MLILYQVSILIFFSVSSSEGKVTENEILLPFEVMLNSKKENKDPVPETTFLKNKAIELKILSNDNKNGEKVDLIIEATKEIQTTEAKIDKHSPAFNSEYNLKSHSPNNINVASNLNRKWDASRQDTLIQDTSDVGELFPLLMLRQMLNTPHSFLGHNQFSPSQNLKHFENNLQRETMPFHQQWEPAHKLPMHLVVSEPIFTRTVSPNLLNNQHQPQVPQILNMLQNGLFQNVQPQNYNLPPNYHQTNPLLPPASRYPINSGTPQNGYLVNNHNYHQNNEMINKNSLQPNSITQGLYPPLKEIVRNTLSVPNALSLNNRPYSINSQPNYNSERNPNFNNPIQKDLYQHNTLPPTASNLRTIPKVDGHGTRNYQENRESQIDNYKPIINQQPNLNPYQSPQQHTTYHHRPLPNIHSTNLNPYSNDQQHSQHRNVPSIDHSRQNTVGENYGSLPRELPLHIPHPNHQNLQHSLPPQSIPNDYRNHASSNEPISKSPEDDKKIPIYHHSPEGSRPSYYQNIPKLHKEHDNHRFPANTEESYSRSSSISSSSRPSQDHYYSEPEKGQRSVYNEQPDASQEEISNPEGSKYDDDYISNKPVKKRKSRKKKKSYSKDNNEDLEGHSTHQYIIKIG